MHLLHEHARSCKHESDCWRTVEGADNMHGGPLGKYVAYPPGTLVFLGSPANAQSATPICYVALKANVYGTEGAVQLNGDSWQRTFNCPQQPQTTTSEVTIQLVNQTLPPVHALSRLNLAAGAVVARNRTFGFDQLPPSSTPATYCASAPGTATATDPTPATTYYNCVQTDMTQS